MADLETTQEAQVTKENSGRITLPLDAAAAGSGEAEQGSDETRPEWLPEKFKTPEDMAKSYGELEGQLTKQRQEAKQAQTPQERVAIQKPQGDEQPPAGEESGDGTDTSEAEVAEAVESAGLDLDAVTQHFHEHGDISDGDYAALEAVGISRDLVAVHMEGLQAIQAQREQQVYQSVGGEDAYSEMRNWAAETLSDQELEAFNDAVFSTDSAAAQMAVVGLHARYQQSEGSAPQRLVTAEGAPSGNGVFADYGELAAAMGDPRYNSDPAYKRGVVEKLQASSLAKIAGS